MADEKTPDEKKAEDKKAAEKKAAEGLAPRPDPVGERNYAMSEPVVRPEGEGTPGAMRHVAPPVPPVSLPAVAPDAQRRVAIVPTAPVPHSTPPPIVDAPEVRKTTTKVIEPEPRKK
jgi:hypothetical protein